MTPPTSDPLRLGIVGLDSSHVPEFTRRIHALRDAGQTRCTVTQLWTDGDHDMPASEVEQWRSETLGMGVKQVDSLDALLGGSDGVLVLAVNGSKHEALAAEALKRGLPTYIDKPLANDLASARRIYQAATSGGARCYSASSLRFATELEAIPRDALGDLVAVDAVGPGELNDAMPRLLFYGVHTVEMVDAIFQACGVGPGVVSVRADQGDDRDVMQLRYADGRYAHLRLERKGGYDFAATLHGTQGLHHFKVDFAPVYGRLVAGMVNFFEGGDPPCDLRDIVENLAVIERAHHSLEQGGAWIDVPTID
ncbi:MAG: Gfo/Idh/MocA family oxidoreductase [Planctomycetota bacterium]